MLKFKHKSSSGDVALGERPVMVNRPTGSTHPRAFSLPLWGHLFISSLRGEGKSVS